MNQESFIPDMSKQEKTTADKYSGSSRRSRISASPVHCRKFQIFKLNNSRFYATLKEISNKEERKTIAEKVHERQHSSLRVQHMFGGYYRDTCNQNSDWWLKIIPSLTIEQPRFRFIFPHCDWPFKNRNTILSKKGNTWNKILDRKQIFLPSCRRQLC